MSDSPTVATRRIYTGRVLNLDIDTVRFPNGAVGSSEIIRHSGASAVVPFVSDPTGPDPQVMLIRQYRYAAGGYVYEIPAGRLDPDELPVACAHRELREETGCSASGMERLFTMFTTPGFTDEKIHVFMATGLTRGATAREDDEFLEVESFSLAQALAMVESGKIQDGKTALGLPVCCRLQKLGSNDVLICGVQAFNGCDACTGINVSVDVRLWGHMAGMQSALAKTGL